MIIIWKHDAIFFSFLFCYLCLFWFLGLLVYQSCTSFHMLVFIRRTIKKSRTQSRLSQAPLYIPTETSILSYKNRLQEFFPVLICTIDSILSHSGSPALQQYTASLLTSAIINLIKQMWAYLLEKYPQEEKFHKIYHLIVIWTHKWQFNTTQTKATKIFESNAYWQLDFKTAPN